MMSLDFDTDFSSPPQWASMYREHGLQVVPAIHPKEDRINPKRPALPQWRSLEHEIIPDLTFERWYGEDGTYRDRAQMGLITGACSGGVFVLDLDTHTKPTAADWWLGLLAVHNNSLELETPRQTTGGGGKQMFFRAPAGWTPPTNRTSIGVDIRGQGGFAVLPPSLHVSGRHYEWDDGLELWATEIATAPEWLCDAIDELVGEHGGSAAPRDRVTANDSLTAFGRDLDGREDKMTRLIWARLIDLKREAPMISRRELDEAMAEAWEVYERTTATRIHSPGVTNAEGLEREGRGQTAFREKWARACRKWDEEIAEEAKKEPVEKPRPFLERAEPAPQPRVPLALTDFATLFLEDVPEEPDYIEPNLIGPGGFMLIAGPPKAQKSFLLQEILVACATGRDFLGHFKVPRPLRVFYLQAEMNMKLLRRRAKAMTDLTPVHLDALASNLIVTDRFRMVLTEHGVQQAVEAIRGAFMGEPPDIIAIDPLANVFDQENENDNTQMMRFLTARVEAIRQAVNPMAGIIMVHHATKKTADEIARDPFVAIRGGGALRGYYDAAVVMFRKSEDGPERAVHFELRGGEAPEPMTVKLQDGRFLQVASQAERRGMKGSDVEFLLDEIDRRWKAREPFAVGGAGKRLTLDVYIMRHFGLTRNEARQEVERLVAIEAIKPEIYDAKRKVSGWKTAKNDAHSGRGWVP